MKNVIIIILSIIVLALGGYLVYDKFIANELKETETKEENIETNEEVKADEEIMNLTTDEINKYLEQINSGTVGDNKTYLGQLIEYYDENYNLKLDINLFDKQPVKNSIAVYLGNITLSTEENLEGIYGTGFFAPYDEFKEIYEITWNEEVTSDTHQIEGDRVLCYEIGSGMGIPQIELKAKEITFQDGIYTIKTYVGVFNNSGYDYNNNYEGQIKFEKNEDNYHIISYVITEI